ncbi:MAG TPA: ion channel [Candidatus Paceibacterota bacterium]|nr:ion channel [Candidatus Paceibacterota bacterium]
MTHPERLAGNNIILLVCLLALILCYPLFQKDNSLVRDLLLTGIFFSGIYSLEFSARSRMVLLPLASLTAATTWIHHYIETDWMSLIDFGTSSVTLAVIVVLMIRHIARSRVVTPTIILSSVNGYVLLGVLGATLFSIANGAHRFFHGAESAGILLPDKGTPDYSDDLYLSFITLTTVGYGDVVTVSHLTRSVAILIGLSGQMYMTILIAMLVGKFLAANERR